MRHTALGELTPESAARIRHIRDQIEKANIPASKLDENLIVGTWNVRNFGKSPRSTDAKRIIAEIIGQIVVLASDHGYDFGRSNV